MRCHLLPDVGDAVPLTESPSTAAAAALPPPPPLDGAVGGRPADVMPTFNPRAAADFGRASAVADWFAAALLFGRPGFGEAPPPECRPGSGEAPAPPRTVPPRREDLGDGAPFLGGFGENFGIDSMAASASLACSALDNFGFPAGAPDPVVGAALPSIRRNFGEFAAALARAAATTGSVPRLAGSVAGISVGAATAGTDVAATGNVSADPTTSVAAAAASGGAAAASTEGTCVAGGMALPPSFIVGGIAVAGSPSVCFADF